MNLKNIKTELKNGILYADNEPLVALSEKKLQEIFIKNFIFESDRVLEIGYGLGLSARVISGIKPKTHIIVELNKGLCENAKNETPEAIVVNSDWRNLEDQIFKKIDKVVYEVGPENCNLKDREFALAHVKPAVEVILKKINIGASIGIIDPSSKLTVDDIKDIVKDDIFVRIVECSDDFVPNGLPWFKNGCNFLYIRK